MAVKAGRPKLTEAEKIERESEKLKKREEQKERLILKLAKIRSGETKAARRERARDLIKIGSIISQYHDVKELIEYLKKPKYIIIQKEGLTTVDEKPEDEKVKVAIFLSPRIAPKK